MAAEHDPLTCELCHAEGVTAEIRELRAERDRAVRERDELAEAANELMEEVRRVSLPGRHAMRINVALTSLRRVLSRHHPDPPEQEGRP